MVEARLTQVSPASVQRDWNVISAVLNSAVKRDRLNIMNTAEWHAHAKSGDFPDDIPVNLRGYYKNKGWKGMRDFLGTNGK